MHPPDGYQLEKTLRSSPRSEVCAAVRESDGCAVVLKCTLGRSAERLAAAQAELDALQRVAGTGVPRVLDLIAAGDEAPVLVLERVPGMPLGLCVEEAPLAPHAFLTVALQLAEILARVHAQRLIHRDVNPMNIMVDPETLQTHLIDFGLARQLGAALLLGERRAIASVGLAGTLPYIAPEQTGRMDRGVDSRSDLYSLGASLYHALTGSPPFEDDDALALVHAHLAKVPLAPIERRPDLPATLSRIITKLLQKGPEERYQTAHALSRDLAECQSQLERMGRIEDDLPLGTGDAPYRPLFAKKLYGREAEVRTLHDAYANASAGRLRALLLGGAPGVGKSALVDELRRMAAESGGCIAQGKFDLYRRDVPFAGFAGALQSFADQILTESDERLARWRAELAPALGAVARVLVDLVPDFGVVLGETPPVPALGPRETLARLALALQRFLQVAAKPEHPLVLFLDDLQWSDGGSRDLLRALLLELPSCALLLLCAYRDNEVDAEHPIARLFGELERGEVPLASLGLGPLPDAACAQMLADALGRSAGDVRSLAAHALRKTGNVPLLIQQFVYHLYDQGLIHFEAGVGWTWDEAAVAAADIAEGAVELITQRIARLSDSATDVIELASCVGNVFQLETLGRLTETAQAHLEQGLFELCEEGLIAPAHAGFRFVHDRIREAAQRLLSEGERVKIHLQAARLLVARLEEEEIEEHVFEIADHFNLAVGNLDATDRAPAMDLNLRAGKRALLAGAPAAALRYGEHARALFSADDWESQFALGFELWLVCAESAYQTRDYAAALATLAELEARPLERMQAVQVAAKVVSVWQMMPDGQQQVRVVLDALRRFGVRWPERPSWLRTRWAIWRTDRALAHGKRAFDFEPMRPVDPSAWLPALMIMSAGGGTLSVNSSRFICLVTGHVLSVFRRHGYALVPGYSLAGHAGYRAAFLRHLRGAEVYAEAALLWKERMPDPLHSYRIDYLVNAFVYAWTRPRSSVLEPLERVAEGAREAGDIEYRYYALLQRANYLALSGGPLEVVERDLEAVRKHSHLDFGSHLAAVRLLRSGLADASQLEAALAALPSPLAGTREALLSPWVFWLQIVCVLGGWSRLAEIEAQMGGALLDVGSTLSQLADFFFLKGIAAARSGSRAELRRALRQLRIWARDGADFVHMAQGLEAERLQLRGRHPAALALFLSAAQRAEQRGHGHQAALLHERRAHLLETLRRDTEAGGAFERARSLYEAWGAATKVAQLERRRRRSLS